jgi:hypothetical protein
MCKPFLKSGMKVFQGLLASLSRIEVIAQTPSHPPAPLREGH